MATNPPTPLDTDQLPEDLKFRRYVVARMLPLSRLLARDGIELPPQGGIFYCPFHNDEGGLHPSAKLFKDEDGERLYCFSEGRQYTSWDALERLLSQDPHRVFRKIWATKLTAQQRASLMHQFGVPKDYLPANWEEFVAGPARQFKRGEIPFREFLVGLQDVVHAPVPEGEE